MDIFPKCEVCHQHFKLKGSIPYLLPCLHAVCETCVTSTASGVISCSTCRRDVNLTEIHLQKDVVRQREIFHLTVQHRPSELLCTHEDDGNQAVCWCQECEKFFCEHCQNLHESFKATRRHAVQEIGDLVPEQMNQEQFCRVHTSCPLDFWDKSCDVLICSRCRRGDHGGHDVVDVEAAANTARAEIEQDKQTLLLARDRQRESEGNTRQHFERSKENAKVVKQNISHTFHSLKNFLDQREKEIIVEHEQTEISQEVFQVRLTALERNQLRLETTTGYINKSLSFLSRYDILTLKKTLRETTQNCITPLQLDQHSLPPLLNFKAAGLDKLKLEISNFGKISANNPDATSNGSNRQDTKRESGQVKKAKEADTELQYKKQFEQMVTGMKGHGLYFQETDGLPYIIKCIPLQYDIDKVNTNSASICNVNELVNDSGHEESEGQLRHYYGTCATAPIAQLGYLQYWEMVTDIDVRETLDEHSLILEIGLSPKHEQDTRHAVNRKPNSYSMTVVHCTETMKICRHFWKHGIQLYCLPETVSNKPKTTYTMQHGIAFDDKQKTLAFIDVKNSKIMSVMRNINCTWPLWPMFGVYSPEKVGVKMKLVAAKDIDMTPEKKSLIVDALL